MRSPRSIRGSRDRAEIMGSAPARRAFSLLGAADAEPSRQAHGAAEALRRGIPDRLERQARGAALLRHPAVGAAVKRAIENRARRVRVTADRVLREYERIAFADIRRVIAADSKGGHTMKS